MGYTRIYNHLITDTNLSSSEFRVFAYLLLNWNKKDGYAYPTMLQIQKALKMGNNTVNKSIQSLNAKGYISIGKHTTRNGENNVYYISEKYRVVDEDNNKTQSEPHTDDLNNEPVNSMADNLESNTEQNKGSIEEPAKELSANELLLINKVGIDVDKLKNEQREQINQIPTDTLIEIIERAKKYSDNVNAGYIIKIYKNDLKNKKAQKTIEEPHNNNVIELNKKPKAQNKKQSSPTVKTTWHGSFNEHHKKYTDEELERQLLRIQNSKK